MKPLLAEFVAHGVVYKLAVGHFDEYESLVLADGEDESRNHVAVAVGGGGAAADVDVDADVAVVAALFVPYLAFAF